MVEKSDFSSAIPSWFNQMYEPMRRVGEKVAEFFSPSSEAATTESYYEISVELPGVSDEDIRVEVHDGRLSVTGEKRSERHKENKSYFFSERTYGKFQRVFRLPADADESKVSAAHKDGVLTIKIAKSAPQEKGAKSIPINKG
ncbi:MAG: glutamyl-tRNA amidotransferase [Rhodospirillaceae bacterium]|nr:glutamyl-tRNA amidotransferase [Magnetovibrio sp.]MAY67827.1 glutamyl-tRNA amidotransferase [Rhodospirillaceae bacterium]